MPFWEHVKPTGFEGNPPAYSHFRIVTIGQSTRLSVSAPLSLSALRDLQQQQQQCGVHSGTMDPTSISPNCVGWNILEGYPWWPVFICDPTKLRPNLHLLGTHAVAVDQTYVWWDV